ncbi:oxysterol-binding protein-related protein 6-like isoform X2 [Ostrea edulis]|uniref:oxysterol-binding protein-related protein 6-like isoform X2 n=1 Tax=Ostrea edulis TaxID=37623 RepID=UPI0024AFFA59|nr:oxysterol-binding protein-related protein 6-like isoform X2 [Ostrea edulis]
MDWKSEDGSDDVSISSSLVDNNKVAAPDRQNSVQKSTSSSKKSRKIRKSRHHDWEILEGLKDGVRCEEKPDKFCGFLMKRRRWPLKGWHKRYFLVEKGIVYYAKSPADIQKGKYHGVIDTGLSVVSFKKPHRIDIDAEDIVYHLKMKDKKMFDDWLKVFRHHRLYRQHEIAYGTKESPKLTGITSPVEDLTSMNLPEALKRESQLMGSNEVIPVMRKSSFKNQTTSQGRVATWLLDTSGFEQCSKEMKNTQKLLCDLREDLNQLRNLPLSSNQEMKESEMSDKKKLKAQALKSSRKRDKKSESSVNFDSSPTTVTPPSPLAGEVQMRNSNSNPNLIQYAQDHANRPRSVPDHIALSNVHEEHIKEIKLREDFCTKAERVHQNLKALLHTITTERERLKSALEIDSDLAMPSSAVVIIKQNLHEALRQNADLKARLSRIHAESSLPSYPDLKQTPASPILSPGESRDRQDLTKSSSLDTCSMSEYYDAEEENRESVSESSSERSDEEDISSENDDTEYNAAQSVSEDQLSVSFETGRRSKLPVPKPDSGDISLWNILYKNIGKDLTKISMPVTLNEPLSMLQRLCEEMEYSELLDRASENQDPYQRMICIAAFAVSGYASSGYRAGHKPFNPILGETYELLRDDKGWKFVAEQVSHHPPVSACHCESKNFTLWQDTRIKTKFWGKSMEFQPVGHVNVYLPKYKEHYMWNKVTTCVHNLLGGQRWVDQYGEMQIRNGGITCKLTFKKASQFSSRRHEVYGQILNPEGKVVHNLFGKWNEALYYGHAPSSRCVWRPGAMPDDYELYYGFTRFAIELNELNKDEARILPITDTRFRPDQRLLEEGDIKGSEEEKKRVEQLQRDNRKLREEQKIAHNPRWFSKVDDSKGHDCYEFNCKYWEMKREPGFEKLSLPRLW